MKALCVKYGVPLFINDDVEIAMACGADGVHIGQHDAPAGTVRKMIGPDMMLGVSAQTVEQALKRPELRDRFMHYLVKTIGPLLQEKK